MTISICIERDKENQNSLKFKVTQYIAILNAETSNRLIIPRTLILQLFLIFVKKQKTVELY